MSMLQAALSREGVARDHIAAVAVGRRGERDAVVAAIHKAFKPEQAALEKLVLRGKYLNAAPSGETQKLGLTSDYDVRVKQFGSPYCTQDGLELYLGTGHQHERLLLRVVERTETSPLSVEIEINRCPHKSEEVATFHGHSDVEGILERFFEVVARHVVIVKSA
jgi:hypothetical protein